MSVVLYKKGVSVDMNGLGCDILVVAPELFNVNQLPSGWFLTPEGAYEEQEQAHKEVVEAITEEVKEEPQIAETPIKKLTGNAKIRNDAKEAGIEDWEKARIATLKEKLKA